MKRLKSVHSAPGSQEIQVGTSVMIRDSSSSPTKMLKYNRKDRVIGLASSSMTLSGKYGGATPGGFSEPPGPPRGMLENGKKANGGRGSGRVVFQSFVGDLNPGGSPHQLGG